MLRIRTICFLLMIFKETVGKMEIILTLSHNACFISLGVTQNIGIFLSLNIEFNL